MLNNDQLVRSLREAALLLGHEFNPTDLRFSEINRRQYSSEEFIEFKRDLVETGSKIRLLLLEYSLPIKDFEDFLATEKDSILVFQERGDALIPTLIKKEKKRTVQLAIEQKETISSEFDSSQTFSYKKNEQGEVLFFVIIAYQGLVSEYGYDKDFAGEKMNPVKRLLRLLSTERIERCFL